MKRWIIDDTTAIVWPDYLTRELPERRSTEAAPVVERVRDRKTPQRRKARGA